MTRSSTSLIFLTFAFTFAPVTLARPQPPKEHPMPRTVRREAAETLTAVELNRGETLEFKLRSGAVRRLLIGRTAAAIVEEVKPGGIVYHFTCRVRIDGHPMTLQRYVCSQECFYEPYVVNGMRIWLDAVSDIMAMIPMRSMETQRAPHAHVRLAVQDATLGICPQRLAALYPNDENYIDVGDCYNGDDCWLGPYLGKACHGGLDINHAKGEPLWAPIDLDDHWLFNSLAAGHNNNRWRGIRKWPNGDVWALQSHHLVKLLVPEHTKLKRGTQYATAAGVWVGSHQHTHYVFKVAPRTGGPEIHLDPWILFREIFEARREAAGEIRAAMGPLQPAKAGESIALSARGSRKGKGAEALRYYWSFGDGGWATGPRSAHAFARPGVYPVTLVVDDGTRRASCTRHITVDAPAVDSPALVLAAPDEPTFRRRPVHAMDVYGWPVRSIPHTLRFVARKGRPAPGARTVRLRNAGTGALPKAKAPSIRYLQGADWLKIEPAGKHTLKVSAGADGLKLGRYEAIVSVDVPGALNSPQAFRVELDVRRPRRAQTVIVDDRDDGFYCTPYFWVGHRFCRCKRRGHAGFYLTNGGRAVQGELARFTPDLPAGRYEVTFHERTPFTAKARFDVRIRHAGGEDVVRVNPSRSRRIGTFDFHEGADGLVEILAAGSKGVIAADAVVFRRAAQGPPAE
jgi:PKD repeat protein